MKKHNRIKHLSLCLIHVALVSSFSFSNFANAQNLAQTSTAVSTDKRTEGVTETQITHLTLSDQEQADHWKLSVNEWEKYQKYMAIEGKYFYAHLDPVTTLSITTKDPAERQRYIALSVLKERDRVTAEVNFANDAFRVQRSLFGEEDLFDFNKLPQNDGKYRDKTIMYRDGTSEAEKIEALKNKATIEEVNQPKPKSASNEQLNAMNTSDQIYFVIDAKCENCQSHIQALLDQPLQIVLLMKNSTDADLVTFYKKYKLQSFVDKGRIKIRMYDKKELPDALEAELSDIFMGKNDQILKKVN